MTADWQEDIDIETWAAALRDRIGGVVTAWLDIEKDLQNVKRRAAESQRGGGSEARDAQQDPATELPVSIRHRHVGDNTIISVHGELDVYTSPRLRSALIDLVGKGYTRHIIDLNQVIFLDSTALGILSGNLKRTLSCGGGTLIVSESENIRKIFRITGVKGYLPVLESVEEACAAMDVIIPELARRAAHDE